MTELCAICDHYMLVAAMNPCPYGYHGDALKPCTCSSSAVTRYQKRISGPIMDRIDIHVEVPRVDYEKLSDDRLGEPSATIQARVEALVGLGYSANPRLTHSFDIILQKQDAQGCWPLEYDYTGKTWVDFGPKKQPNKWVTLRALRVPAARHPV